MGRPAAWNPIMALDDRSWLETVEVASEGRISLPIEVRRRVGWKPSGKVMHLLAILSDDESIELIPWQTRGVREIERVAQAVSHLQDGDRREALLAAMDRYAKASLARDGRVILPNVMVAHLLRSDQPMVRVVAYEGRIWLWPEHIWQSKRAARFERLDALLSAKRSVRSSPLGPTSPPTGHQANAG